MKKIILGVVVFTALIVAGISAYSLYKSSAPIAPTEDQVLSNKNSLFDRKSKLIIARPSNGPLIMTQELTLPPLTDHELTFKIQNDKAENLKQNQRIILFTKQNEILPIAGTLTDVMKHDVDSTISVKLPPEVQLETLSNTVKVMTFVSRTSQRLPLEALEYDDEENPFIWMAKPTEDKNKFIAKKIWVDDVRIGDNYFEPNIRGQAYNYYILNPKRISEDKTYVMQETRIKAPHFDPIRQADHDIKTAAKKAYLRARSDQAKECGLDLGQSVPNQSEKITPKAAACGISPYKDKDAIEIFNDILKRR